MFVGRSFVHKYTTVKELLKSDSMCQSYSQVTHSVYEFLFVFHCNFVSILSNETEGLALSTTAELLVLRDAVEINV